MFFDQSFGVILIFLLSSVSYIGQCSEAGNWFTKSLDYYSLEKCSFLDKSNMAGDLYACLNSPVDPSTSSTGSPTASTSGSPAKSGFGDWSSFSSKGGQTNGPQGGGKAGGNFGTSAGSFGGQSSGYNNFASGSSKTATSSDSWPLSLVSDLQHTINCFPKLIKPCMTRTEVNFYNTIRDFFQAQVNYASPNALLIAQKIAKSGCVKSNSIDTSTVCYSTNIHKENWFGWKINWNDGQMCRFIGNMSSCELASFDKCSPDIVEFAKGIWKAGLRVTSCPEIESSSDSSSASTASVTSPTVGSTKLASSRPVRLLNVTNVSSRQEKKLEVNFHNVTVNKIEPSSSPNSDRKVNPRWSTNLLAYRANSKVNQEDERVERKRDHRSSYDYDDNNDNDFENREEVEEINGPMKHLRWDRAQKSEVKRHPNQNIDRKWFGANERFQRKMREEEDVREEIDNDQDLELQRKLFHTRPGPWHHLNQEDERRVSRRQDHEKRLRDNEDEARMRREEFERQRKREREEREKREEQNRRMVEEERQRRQFEEEEERQRRRNEEEERRRRAERRQIDPVWSGEDSDEEDDDDNDDEMIIRPPRHLVRPSFNSRPWDENNDNQGYDDMARNCMQSWSSTNQNPKPDDLMEMMCRYMDSMHSCLQDHLNRFNSKPPFVHHLDHLKVTHQALCESDNHPKGPLDVSRIRQCLTDQRASQPIPSSTHNKRQMRQSNGPFRPFWN